MLVIKQLIFSDLMCIAQIRVDVVGTGLIDKFRLECQIIAQPPYGLPARPISASSIDDTA